jgi:hypothetical protein
MEPITASAVETQLLVYAAASAVALASQNDVVTLDLDDEPRQPSPGAQRVRVAEKLAEAMTELDKVIRARKTPPANVSVATLARKLVQWGERTDPRGGSYTPGTGLSTLISTALLDAAAELREPIDR